MGTALDRGSPVNMMQRLHEGSSMSRAPQYFSHAFLPTASRDAGIPGTAQWQKDIDTPYTHPRSIQCTEPR